MKTKLCGWLTLFFALAVQIAFAQTKTVSGTVTDGSGVPLPGVNIIVEGTSTGTQSDFDGNYSLQASEGDVLVFSYVGFSDQQETVGASNTIDVSLEQGEALEEVVVTALGIAREKKSLGYATQQVDGAEVSDVPTQNFVNSLSGKVAGLQINNSGTMGGSSNVIIRGSASLTGNNQALFVIDGTPISNDTPNTSGQQRGQGGYDYGNAASDLNPYDIKSINVLKGAAATALYGARAANGAIIIETKKGNKNEDIGVTINSTLTTTHVNKNTLPVYQDQYGAGYGPFYDTPYFNTYRNIDIPAGFDPSIPFTPFTEDVSFGAAFDGQPIYQWTSIYPQLEGYQQATPWQAGRNTPNDMWNMGYNAINSVALSGGSDVSTFRLSFTNFDQRGNLPNSSIKRNTIKFSGTQDFTDKFSAAANVTFTKTDGRGRYGTGYDAENPMQQFRQWWQTNVDVFEQRDAYLSTRENITWNPNSPINRFPIYMDNPYWTRYENYSTDTRNRFFGNFNLTYEINDIFSVLGRFTFDAYDELQEERRNVGSNGVSGYSRYNNRVAEYNYDVILNVNTDLAEGLNLDGNLGWNLRRNERNSIRASTNGGLSIPSFYDLANSVSPLVAPTEYDADRLIDGVYARASLGYQDTYFLEGTLRRDRSSTLPVDNNVFYYPSVSGNVILSNFFDSSWLSFTKLRANYAEVGNDTDPYRVFNRYFVDTPFAGTGVAYNFSDLNNIDLRPERTKNVEVGLETNMFDNRIGLDISYYNAQTEDQITPVPVSMATGFNQILFNAGTIENQGYEVSLRLNPIRSEDFNWNMNINWNRNRNKVLSLAQGIDNLELASLQGGVSINAAPGQPYGAIRGTDYIYDDNGNKVVSSSTGYYQTSSNSNEIIGNIQPDWRGGVQNTVQYKNLTLSFLVDVQSGGDIYSLDTWYGFATGGYDQTVGTNDLGNPIRNSLSNGGGIILPGVNENGEPNTTRASFNSYINPYGYTRDANKGHVYDASFVKLREVNFTYAFTDKMLKALPFTQASISLVGRNLWIIHKNIPYSDPEAGLSAGNIQGYQSGAYPAVREIGASLRLNF